MTAFRVNNGDIWNAFLANSALVTIPDGNTEIPGHAPKIIDDWLSDDPENIKGRFYDWYDNFQLSTAGGLTINYNAGVILDDTGYAAITAGQLVLTDNSNSYIFINKNKTIEVGVTLPERCYPIGLVTTFSGVVTEIVDLREKRVNRIENLSGKSAFEPGDIKFTTRKIVTAGWLLCDYSYVSPTIYSALFNVIGYSYGQSGSLFRLPPNGKTIRASTDVNQIGQTMGSDQVILTENQLPRHRHTINDSGHNHGINDSGHDHGSYNLGHSHGISQSPHSHGINDPGHVHTPGGLIYRQVKINGFTNDFGAELSSANLTNTPGIISAPTGISVQNGTVPLSVESANLNFTVQNKTSNVNVNSSKTGISMSNTGNNGPIDITPSSLIVNMWIKT